MAQMDFRQANAPERLEAGAAGSIAGAVATAGAVVLSIIGLAGGAPFFMVSVSCICLGAALLFEGGAIAARYSRALSSSPGARETGEVEGGVAAEALAGAAGVALGILALVGVAPVVLTSIAAIVFGGGMIFGSSAVSRVGSIRASSYGSEYQQIAREAVFVSAGGEVLIGVGALVLGILAIIGVAPLVLTLIAFLGVGGSLMLSGTALGAKMLSVLRRY